MKKYFVQTILVIAALLIGAVATSQTSTAAFPACPPFCPPSAAAK